MSLPIPYLFNYIQYALAMAVDDGTPIGVVTLFPKSTSFLPYIVLAFFKKRTSSFEASLRLYSTSSFPSNESSFWDSAMGLQRCFGIPWILLHTSPVFLQKSLSEVGSFGRKY